MATVPLPKKFDNFYTPQNEECYSQIGYEDLETKDHKIRLLKIKPLKSWESNKIPVQAILVDNQSLSDMEGKFTTLSYAAGNPHKTETITINGYSFNAFANLGHALRLARRFWKKRFGNQELLLWADQVCINQQNTKERSHQVGFMGDIYGAAKQVFVCLSVEGDGSGGLHWLSKFTDDYNKYKRKLFNTGNHVGTEHDSPEEDDHFVYWESYADRQSSLRDWNAFIKTILNSRWWRRAWIRQEFLRSPDAYFLAGNESMHWQQALDGIDLYSKATKYFRTGFKLRCGVQTNAWYANCWVCHHGEFLKEIQSMGKCASDLLQGRKSQHHSEFPDLLDRLRQVHACEASNPKDLIYASFGISNHNYNIYPEYSPEFSVEDLLVQLARNVIVNRQELSQMLRNAYQTRSTHGDDLPTWVPDWRQSGHSAIRKVKQPLIHPEGATFLSDAQGRSDRVLRVQGVAVEDVDAEFVKALTAENFLHPHVRPLDNPDGTRVPGFYYHWCPSAESYYIINGTTNIFILQPDGDYFKIWGEVVRAETFVSKVEQLLDHVHEMVERGDGAVINIDIC